MKKTIWRVLQLHPFDGWSFTLTSHCLKKEIILLHDEAHFELHEGWNGGVVIKMLNAQYKQIKCFYKVKLRKATKAELILAGY